MHRRNILATAFAAAGALIAAGGRSARAQEGEPARDANKVVYHLSDLEKVSFVLGNIENHLAGVGARVMIALVVHGPALRAFLSAGASQDTTRQVAGFVKRNVTFYACSNTMRGQNITLKELLPSFAIAERGGVVLIAGLQAQGYAYLRP